MTPNYITRINEIIEKAKIGYYESNYGLKEGYTREQLLANGKYKREEFHEDLRVFASIKAHSQCVISAERYAIDFWIAANIPENDKYLWSGAKLPDNPGMIRPRPHVNQIEWYRRLAALIETVENLE